MVTAPIFQPSEARLIQDSFYFIRQIKRRDMMCHAIASCQALHERKSISITMFLPRSFGITLSIIIILFVLRSLPR